MIEFLITYKSIIVVLHALVGAVGLGAVVITDTLFFQYLKDLKISPKEEETMNAISRVVWVIIVLLFITGAALYFSAPLDYLSKSKFVVKVIIFGVIVANGFLLNLCIAPVLRKIRFGPSDHPLASKLRLIRSVAFASGAVSMISWFSVFLLGSIRSIPVGVGTGLLVYLVLIGFGIVGSQVFGWRLAHPHVRMSSQNNQD